MRITGSDGSVRYWGLSTTFEPKDSEEAFKIYELRTQIEERHRQIKNYWHLNKFSSPNRSLIEAHVMFTLLTYSLLQLYLSRKHLNRLANKTIKKLREEELAGKITLLFIQEDILLYLIWIDILKPRTNSLRSFTGQARIET